MLRSAGRPPADRLPNRFGPARRRLRAAAGAPPAEAGFLLVEVIISALLVGLIVIATLTGFDVVNRASASQRQHDQAALLAAAVPGAAAQRSRSHPADAPMASPHSYTQTVGGAVYTIKQSAELLPVERIQRRLQRH